MFKNLVSNLPFSPSLAGQLGSYVRRLREEEVVRRAGLIFITLALAVQGLIIFAPAGMRPSAGTQPAPPSTAPAGEQNMVASETVANLTAPAANADKTTASPGDRLEYTLTVRNTGAVSGTYTIRNTIGDVLEYAVLADAGGGTVESASAGAATPDTISWPPVLIAPGQTAIQKFIVAVKDPVPAAAVNPGNPGSYDCRMADSFGRTTIVDVDCPAAKTIETVAAVLPPVGPVETLLLGVSVLAGAAFFYVRSRQLGREIRLIRRDANAGVL